MRRVIEMEISIPADNEGYVLFQCPLCGDFFKVKPEDYEDDGVLEIHCPFCGLCSENYFTEDVLELAEVMVKNAANDLIFSELKKWENELKGGFVSFKAGKRPKLEPEEALRSGIEALTITHFNCCKRSVKIKPLLRITGCYCPFCGVKEYVVE